MLQFALLGAGRIGAMHARNLVAHPQASLAYVYDIDPVAARAVAARCGATAVADAATIFADRSVDAVLIASSTNTHIDFLSAAAHAGKAVFCEKPIDIDINRVNACWKDIAACHVPIQIGFNRRYDPNHRAVYDAVRAAQIGQVELVVISSRDPALPSTEYLKVSGGLFRDMMIHDFDLACFILGEEPVTVSAMGSVMVDPELSKIDDIDTAMVTLQTARGGLCHINNSRRSVYGYDQRLEVFGAHGMLCSNNPSPLTVTSYTATSTDARRPLMPSFLERYARSYQLQLADFITAVETGRTPEVTFEDGRQALLLADAASEAFRTGRVVRLAV